MTEPSDLVIQIPKKEAFSGLPFLHLVQVGFHLSSRSFARIHWTLLLSCWLTSQTKQMVSRRKELRFRKDTVSWCQHVGCQLFFMGFQLFNCWNCSREDEIGSVADLQSFHHPNSKHPVPLLFPQKKRHWIRFPLNKQTQNKQQDWPTAGNQEKST